MQENYFTCSDMQFVLESSYVNIYRKKCSNLFLKF